MEIQIFEKRSFWAMAGLSVVTFGIFYVYYYVRTTGQLRRAGNQIPSMAFLFVPSILSSVLEFFLKDLGLINEFNVTYLIMLAFKIATYLIAYYFWFNYIKAYCHTIKYNSNATYVWKHFLTFIAASWAPVLIFYFMKYLPNSAILYIDNHPLVIIPILASLLLYGNLAMYLLFQKGFNEHVDQSKILEK